MLWFNTFTMAGVKKDCGQKRDQWRYKPEKHEHGKQLNYHCLKRVHLLRRVPQMTSELA